MGDEQRQEMEWNMLDNAATSSSASAGQRTPVPAPAPGSLTIVSDNDPVLQQELEAAEEGMETGGSGRGTLNGSARPRPGILPSSVEVQHGHALDTAHRAGDVLPEGSMRQFFRRREMREQVKPLLEWSACVPAYSKDHPRSRLLASEWHWEVGRFTVRLVDHSGLPVDPQHHLSHFQQCSLCFAFDDDSKHIIYYEVYDRETEEESKAKTAKKRTASSWYSAKKKIVVEDQLGLYWFIKTDFSDAWPLFRSLMQSGKKNFQVSISFYGK